MKKSISLLLSLALMGTCIFTACHKPEMQQPNNPPASGMPGILVTKEFFSQPWQKSVNGFQIIYKTTRINPDQVSRGLGVTLAVIGAGEGPWIQLPATYTDINITDTVHLSFQASPGELKISARTNFDLSNQSADVQIDYN